MGTPLVSILMPFKDTAHFLPECLDSIQAQTYPLWELLAVDDQSADASAVLVKSYNKKDPRIKLLNNKGEGIIPALRTAYESAKGHFITRMDSDDIMKPDKLKHMRTALETFGKGGIALGMVSYFSSRGISNGYRRYESWLNRLTKKGSNFDERYKECVIPSPCWMVHRDDLESCGAFDEDRYPEDYDLAFRMFAAKLICLPCDEILHLWRDYDSRTSRTSPHYAQNYFLEIKVHYFLKLDWQKHRPLILWGAGTKGKEVAKLLKKIGVSFLWVCDNPKKIGKRIYGLELFSNRVILGKDKPQSIITVANVRAQEQIRQFLQKNSQREMSDFFFFC
jgi:glycosyltransferase involved in cell wall biosynthesis